MYQASPNSMLPFMAMCMGEKAIPFMSMFAAQQQIVDSTNYISGEIQAARKESREDHKTLIEFIKELDENK